MPTNLVQKITHPTDLEPLKQITSRVIGEICWKASLSYGDELSLHIGARVSYSQKSMVGKEKGSWILGTRGTAWRLGTVSKTLVNSEDEPEIIRQKVYAIENTRITAFETNYPNLALTVAFSNGYQLILFPSTEDNLDLPYWELFTPYRMLLKAGPNAVWYYTSSDLPNTQDP